MNNIFDFTWLIPILPLIGFLINGLGRKVVSKGLASTIASAAVLGSFIISLLIFFQVRAGHTADLHYFDLFRTDDLHIGFDFKIDQLTSLFLLIITGIGFLIHVYSAGYMHGETAPDFAKYFAYLNLFIFSMLLLVLGANFVVLFIGWEGVGLCSYLLIGYWFNKKSYTNAANKAFIMNRIGDLAFLLALFWIVQKIGSLDYNVIFSPAGLSHLSLRDITGITLLLFIGASGKSAQIPLYTWLPDAMAGPTPVSALIHAATMVTAGIYMIARSNVLYTMAPATLTVIAIIGIATAMLAASIALKQDDIKKVLAYSTVSQLGYMFLALGAGAYVSGVFHVMTHAFFKALLFLGAGSVIHAMSNEQDMRFMGGLKKWLPTTHWTMLVGCIAIAGIPPFSGFFSKDQILAAAFQKHWIFWVIGVITAMMTAFYMFRLYAMTFLGKFRGTEEQEHHLHESPASMTIPLIILAVLAAVAGFIGIPAVMAQGADRLDAFLKPVFAQSRSMMKPHELSHQTEWILMAVSVASALAAIFFALARYRNYKGETKPVSGIGKMLQEKWYVDDFYDEAVVQPLVETSRYLGDTVERKGIDGLVNGVGKLVNYGSRQLRWIQSGRVGSYVLLMVIGMIIFFLIELFV